MSRCCSSVSKQLTSECMAASLAYELCRRGVNRRANALVGRATTDVARHRVVNVGVAWLGLCFEQRSCRHDLSRLAVSALHDIEVYPRFLHRLRSAR